MYKVRGQYADRCVYYRLPDHKKYTQAYRGGDHQTSSLKSKYPNNQYPGYRLLGFHSSCRVLLPQLVLNLFQESRVCQLKIPKSPVREVCPKTECPPFVGGETDNTVQNRKISPIPTTDGH